MIYKNLSFLILVFLFFQCKPINERIKEDILSNPSKYESLRKTLLKSKVLQGNINKFTSFSELEKEVQDELNEIAFKKIIYVVLSTDFCKLENDYQIQIIYQQNWTLEYFPCNNIPIKPNEYKEGGFIETWGINNQWYIWVDHDFI
jgi:hypothetical protein